MGELLERYKGGECAQVWAELVAGIDRDGRPIPDEEAEAVARETMERVRRNLTLLVDWLQKRGFQFGMYPDGEMLDYYQGPLLPPDRAIQRKIARLKRLAGPIPLSIRMFWEIVGSVDLTGTLSDWPDGEFDPLIVFPVEASLEEYPEWKACCDEDGIEEVGPFQIVIAPDAIHKANVSGGEPYGIVVPDSHVDAILVNEERHTTFVNYLRISFQWGGFPGFAASALQSPPAEIEELTQGLEPI